VLSSALFLFLIILCRCYIFLLSSYSFVLSRTVCYFCFTTASFHDDFINR
jgi:hypothetical protein